MKNKAIVFLVVIVLMVSLIPIADDVAEAEDGNAHEETAALPETKHGQPKDGQLEEEKLKARLIEVAAPEPVKKVSAKSKGRGRTIIKWSKVKDADGYYVYRALKKNGKYKRIKKTGKNSKRICIHKYKKLRKNKKYYYKVVAFKKIGNDKIMSRNADKDPAKNTLSYKRKYTMTATAYSGGGLCANGKSCRVGRVAVDPDVIPLGTWLYVKGYGFCQACDTGGAIMGNRIDLYYNSEGQCERYGVKKTKVYVLRK